MQTRRGFTIVEILVTLGIIGVLAAILLPALGVVRGSANMAKSQSNMRQTFTLMRDYAVANRETIVPSMFDYSDTTVTPVQGKVRSDTTLPAAQRFRGTWADILWTQAGFGPVMTVDGAGAEVAMYRTDAPDGQFFRNGGVDRSPFRSAIEAGKLYREGQAGVSDDAPYAAPISLDAAINANTFGSRLGTRVEPGMFAANNYFDARPAQARTKTVSGYDARTELSTASGTYFNYGQMVSPEASAYLIDSTAAETIDPVNDEAQSVTPFSTEDPTLCQVAFRYPGDTCCILLLDGHVRSEQRWDELIDLEGMANERDQKTGALRYGSDPDRVKDQGRGVRFRHLDIR
jgi:prepilin-type N-terminal cleavage/methylation domain-containing protein